jgi:hypothetical protein
VCYRDERCVDKKGDKSVLSMKFRAILRIYSVNGAWGADISDSRSFDANYRARRQLILCSILVLKLRTGQCSYLGAIAKTF